MGKSIPLGFFRFFSAALERLYSASVVARSGKPNQDGVRLPVNSYLHGIRHIYFGHNFNALRGFRCEAYSTFLNQEFTPQIEFGQNVRVGQNVHFGAISRITVGDDCLFGSNILVIDHNHGQLSAADVGVPPAQRQLTTKGPIQIGKRVWIGDNVVIFGGVVIGDDVVIGANSVVNRSLAARCVAAGTPAKILRTLGSDRLPV